MRSSASLTLLFAAVLALGGCGVAGQGPDPTASPATATTGEHPLREARAANQSRYVTPAFPDTPMVLDDPNGLETSRLFFEQSGTVVVAGPSDAAQLRAASIAVASHAPMLSYSDETHHPIVAEIERLGASRVLLVGDVQLATTSGSREVIRDPGTLEALDYLTARRFTGQTVPAPGDMVADLAALEPGGSVLLVPAWEQLPEIPAEEANLPAFPAQSRRDARAAPVVIATAASPVVSVANARSYGADVSVLPDPDPASSLASMKTVAGLADRPLIALGGQFGSSEELVERIRAGEEKYS
ncbi:hypothetical protein [Corynebacterium halotolerans]|uniref:Uncharacterized protein n=1 Tax=Corynebacterium halotolerans YIM 70093 = DSM 44683 TaxID=1121362 RepID=M1MX20_9CORY|nr:hypothetical protein [Corynebacterium halotolerans]AGF72304.1 hypothetical protein A605_06490 [Corynebacterium halotolerans YIM 70093 = DSM 44683]